MKKLKKNSELFKRWMIVFFAIILMTVSIVMFSLSFEKYNDGYGTDLSFDMDLIVLFICGISILVYGVYSIVAYYKKLSLKTAYYGAFGTVSVLISFYPLGVFFKAMSKNKPFLENQEYLYIGILGIGILLYLVFSYIADSNKEE
ncbi:MAG: hypothetical protein K2I42_01830 [Anaeroplasmataceae bacterium]|nr:hypothetical protein [Anaeroplasmataceae bacterium]